jgi:hypothetical protein
VAEEKPLTMPPMARTNRNGPAAPSVDALDDLDLDDMFEGGDDGLFAGFDIDMNDMGDITGEPLSPAQRKKSKSGAGKKSETGGANYKSGTDLDAVDLDLFGDIGVDDGATNSPPTAPPNTAKSRRTTKRKIKTPSLDDDDDEYDAHPKKKRKGAKALPKTTKSGRTKKQKGEIPAPPTPTPPAPVPEYTPMVGNTKVSKKKAKAAALAFAKGTPEGHSAVAAAGRFGGLQKRGFPQLPRATSKSKVTHEGPVDFKLTKSKKASVVPPPPEHSVLPSPSPKVQGRKVSSQPGDPAPWLNPKLMDTFCGLKPSATLFYPFMPQMPMEPSMKKCHKHYPMIDKLHSVFASVQEAPQNALPGASVEDAIFKLLTKEMDCHAIKTENLAASIAVGRKSILATDKQRMSEDFKSITALLKRQHDFLYTSLQNMERWSKSTFSPSDYAQIYGPEAANNILMPSPINKKRKSGGILGNISVPIVRIKIKCEGFREPKVAAPLLAQLFVLPPAPLVVAKSEPVRTLKKKRVVTDMEKLALQSDDLRTTSYAEMAPSQRRVQIQEALTRRAHQLEAKYLETGENRRKSLDRRQAALQKVIDDDDLVVINTMTLWKWTDKSSYFAEITADDVHDVVQHAKQPDRDEKDILWEENSIKKSNKRVTKSTFAGSATDTDGDHIFSAGSLFDRLSSLLVDEGSGDEESDESDFDGWDDGENKEGSGTVVDLSNFSLDERAFIHLRAAGLVDESCPPPENPTIIEDDSQEEEEEEANDFDSLITTIKADLLKLQRVNNSRASFFETTARAQIEVCNDVKQREEYNTNLIAKYNQLLKRQKENKKSARQRAPKRADEEWMPW